MRELVGNLRFHASETNSQRRRNLNSEILIVKLRIRSGSLWRILNNHSSLQYEEKQCWLCAHSIDHWYQNGLLLEEEILKILAYHFSIWKIGSSSREISSQHKETERQYRRTDMPMQHSGTREQLINTGVCWILKPKTMNKATSLDI